MCDSMYRFRKKRFRLSKLVTGLVALSAVGLSCGSPSDTAAQQDASPSPSQESPSAEEPSEQEVDIYLFQEGSVAYDRASYVASTRRVQAESVEGRLRAAMQELLKGTTAEEEGQGLTSIFSPKTASMLNDVTLEAGRAMIDFKNLREVIPQGGTSEGGAVLLMQLNHTVFGFQAVKEVEYRMDGSCDAFYEWVQSVCFTLTRNDWEAGRNPLEDM